MITLKKTLLINATSSGATGALLVLFSESIANLFSVKATWPFIEAGIFLLAFAAFVFWVALKEEINQKAVNTITALDIAWVLASVIVVCVFAETISGIGTLAIIGVAAWVALMAYLQYKGRNSLSVNSTVKSI